jgi:hypothetical protein
MDRKDLVRRYKDTPRPAGIYRVVHRPSGRTVLGASPDAPAMLNRIRAQLSLNSHPNKQMQNDWDADGEDAFAFDVVDLLDLLDDPGADIGAELQTLLELWREKLHIDPETAY